jgi:hypothetical protein
VRKLRTILLYALIALPLVLGLIGLLTQTQSFRDRLRSIALTQLDSLLNANVHLGELSGNLVTGFSIDTVLVDVDGRRLLSIDRIELAYNLLGLPGKTIAIKELSLIRPTLTLFRPAGGPWNLTRMIRAHPADTSVSAPFRWMVKLEKLHITGGQLRLVDSASLSREEHGAPVPGTVEYHDLDIRDIALDLSASLGPEQKRAAVSACSFQLMSPDVRVRDFAGTFTVTPAGARIDSMRVVTARSSIVLAASLGDVDLLGGIELAGLKHSAARLSLSAQPADLDELKEFLPAVHFLTGKAALRLEGEGPFGNIAVTTLDLRVGSTALFARGTVTNLNDPGNLLLGVRINESTIVPRDLLALMPSFKIPDFGALGPATLNLEFDGSPKDFRTKFLLETSAGLVRSSGMSMQVGGPSALAYDGEVAFGDINLSRILENPGLPSRLNGTARIRGRGVRFGEFASSADVSIDSSTFRGLPVRDTRISINAAGRTVAARGILSLGDMRARLHAELTEPLGSEPAFHLDGDVASLDLQHILHDTTYTSDLTMKLAADGTGMTWKTLNGTMTMDMSSSRYRDYTVTDGNFHLSLDQTDSLDKRLHFESNLADLNLTGEFDLEYLVALLPFEAQNLKAAFGERLAAIDSSMLLGVDRAALEKAGRALASVPSRLDARFTLSVKDLEPLSIAAGTKTFNGSGLLTGTLRGGYGDLSLNGELVVDDFFYGSADSGVMIEDGRFLLDLGALRPARPLAELAARIEGSATRLLVNRSEFDSIGVTADFRDDQARYDLRTGYNRDAHVRVAGTARVDEASVTARFQSLECAYQDFVWRADTGAVLRVNHVSASLAGLLMRRDTQTVALDATLGRGRTLSARVDGTNIALDDLKYLLNDEELGPQGTAFAGSASVRVAASGTLEDPVYAATLDGRDVSFRTLPFGNIAGSFHYAGHTLTSAVNVRAQHDTTAPPVLTINGTLPLDLSLAGGDNSFPERPMDLRVTSRGTQINILDPLLPTFNELSGRMSCDLALGGSLRHPTYEGTISLDSCSFLFVPNNITYTLDGVFHPRGERIQVAECVVRNVPEDEKGGRRGLVRLGGDFLLRDLKPGDFNLTAEGQLLVVKETTRKASLAVYGDLFVEIGPGPLRFTGEVANSLLRGSLLVSNSSLIFPPTQEAVVEESARSVPVIFVDDTVKTRAPQERRAAFHYFNDGAGDHAGRFGIELKRSKSFMEGLHYDLDIETSGGNVEIRMIFNPATSEELVATMDGRFTIADDGKRWTGDLTINRAYYNFFKRFDATGTIRYTGDFMDPELNILAKYKGSRTVTDTTTSAGRQEPVVVTVKITGTRYKPEIAFSMTIDDLDYFSYRGPKSNDIQSDAIQFIIAGNFPLTTAQRNDLASEVKATAGLSLLTGATSLLTGRLSDLLRSGGLDITVELNYGSKESTELRLSGTALKGYWRYGGTILNDPLNNANLSILYSLGTLFDNPALRNLMFELERRVEPGALGQTNDLKRINSARLFYRFSF